MTQLFKKIALLICFVGLAPSFASAHDFPNFSNKSDIQRLLYGFFRHVYAGSDVTLTFSNKEKYTLHVTKNRLFFPLKLNNGKTIASTDHALSRFNTVQDIIRLWTVDLSYIPSFLPFRNFLELVGNEIGTQEFDKELAQGLFAEAYSKFPTQFSNLVTTLGYSVTDFTTFEPLVSNLGPQFAEEIYTQLNDGLMTPNYILSASTNCLGADTSYIFVKPTYNVPQKNSIIRITGITIFDVEESLLTFRFVDSPVTKQILDLLRQILQQLDLDPALVETVAISEFPLVDETFFDKYSQRQVLAKLRAAVQLIDDINDIAVANPGFDKEPLFSKLLPSLLTVISEFISRYITFYNNTYEPNFTPS